MRRALFLIALAGCGKPTGTITVTTGLEPDTFTKDPKPTRVRVDAVASDGTATTLGDAALTGALTLDLTEQRKDLVTTLRVTARSDDGVVRAKGSSLLLQLGALEGSAALPIFVSRVGELARMPCAMDAREDPSLTIVAGRFVMEIGGRDPSVEKQSVLCDLFSHASLPKPPALPIAPASIAPAGTGVLLIKDDATDVFDLSSNKDDGPASKPDGGTFAEVSGGPTVEGDGGVHYVVGPARRSGAPTDKILRVTSDGKLAFVRLGQARLGAAAAWVPGRGLVVIGGAATGAGVEQISVGATQTTPLPFPSDARTGAAAALDGSRVVVAGAGAPVLYDLACAMTCGPTPFATDPGVRVDEAYGADADGVTAIGHGQDGATHVFRLTASAATEIPLKEPRKFARGVRTPIGALGIAGGAATIEALVY